MIKPNQNYSAGNIAKFTIYGSHGSLNLFTPAFKPKIPSHKKKVRS